MSELIDNTKQRQARLKELILRLHNGDDVEEVTQIFKNEFKSVTGAEIAQMEYNLVQEGVSIEEIQNLCDIHASLFTGSVFQLHSDEITINPITEFEEENSSFYDALMSFKDDVKLAFDVNVLRKHVSSFQPTFDAIVKHYEDKENILFPMLEKRGDFIIPKVMWGVDNKIRKSIKESLQLSNEDVSFKKLQSQLGKTIQLIEDMISKENNVLFPMLLEKLNQADLKVIAQAREQHINETHYDPLPESNTEISDEALNMSMGYLTHEQVNAIFNTVPFDMTFVNAENKVTFVTQGKERIFERPISVINRSVDMCHPPQSVDIVMGIVDDLRSGRKDHEDFWINFRGKRVHIRYYAIRNEENEYLGTLEVTQDISEIQHLEGEKRLVNV